MIDDNEILKFIEDEYERRGICGSNMIRSKYGIGYSRAMRLLKIVRKNLETKKELETENLFDEVDEKAYSRLVRKNQKLQDQNRVLSKEIRDLNRSRNVAEAIVDSIIDLIPAIKNEYVQVKFVEQNNSKVAIIQLSDLHLNEQVEKYHVKGTNEYNWGVAAQRLQKYAAKCKKLLTFHGISDIIIAFTGDIFNSNRRMDEMVTNADALSVALLIGVDLLAQFVLDVSEGMRSVQIFSVFGNESRINQDYTSVHWEHSFDFLNHHVLSLRLKEYDNIVFWKPPLDHSLIIRDVLGANILLIHGHNRTTFEKELVKYALDPEDSVVIHYMLWGHVHESLQKNNVRRSSSMVGGNAYSYHRLGLHSYAEQSMHIIEKEKEGRVPPMNTNIINLDYSDDYPGYELMREDFYNFEQTKSLNKKLPFIFGSK